MGTPLSLRIIISWINFYPKIIFIFNYIYLRYDNIEEFELINIIINTEIKLEVYFKIEIIWISILNSDLYF